jgi:hypothetical protein
MNYGLLILLIVCMIIQEGIFIPVESKQSFGIELRFKKANEIEKAERLKLLHEHQVQHLSLDQDEEKRAEQIANLITNKVGKTGSFPGDINSKSSLITAPVTFGNQTFDLTLDTGSTILWVTSATCNSAACKSHKQYDSTMSATFESMQPTTSFEIEYGSGKIAGELAKETISLGGVSVFRQIFGVTTMQEGGSFEHAQWSGLLGLAYPDLAAFDNIKSKPFFDAVIDQNILNENGFSFWLVKSVNDPPMFFLGSPPLQYYQGTLQFFNVIDKYYWTLLLKDILIDDVSLGLCPPPSYCKVAVDSGTSYMSAPTSDLATILSAIYGSNQPEACQEAPTKVITYVLDGDIKFTLEPDFYFTKSASDKYCKAKYIALDVDPPHGPLHIFGDVFFRKYFVHFDRDKDRVGFAVANREISQEPSLQSLLMKKLHSRNN